MRTVLQQEGEIVEVGAIGQGPAAPRADRTALGSQGGWRMGQAGSVIRVCAHSDMGSVGIKREYR